MDEHSKAYGQIGKVGGHVVKSMIEEVEEKMAAGEHVSAAPDSPAEADMLNQVKQENRASGERAKR